MDPDEQFLHNHILTEYQQEVHRLKFELARSNAQGAAKDKTIAELRVETQPTLDPTPASRVGRRNFQMFLANEIAKLTSKG